MADLADYQPAQSLALHTATLLLQQSARACTTAQTMLDFTNAWSRLGATPRRAVIAIVRCSSVDELLCLQAKPDDALRALARLYRYRVVSLRILAWIMIHLSISETDVAELFAERLVRTRRLMDLGLIDFKRLRLTPGGKALKYMLGVARLPMGPRR